jgi:hypothetical protein
LSQLLDDPRSSAEATSAAAPQTDMRNLENMVRRILTAIEIPAAAVAVSEQFRQSPTQSDSPQQAQPLLASSASEQDDGKKSIVVGASTALPTASTTLASQPTTTDVKSDRAHHVTLGELVADVRRIVSSLDDLHARVDEFSGKPAIEQITVSEPQSAEMKSLLAEREALRAKLQGANDAIQVSIACFATHL